jgi:hypothetical protein
MALPLDFKGMHILYIVYHAGWGIYDSRSATNHNKMTTGHRAHLDVLFYILHHLIQLNKQLVTVNQFSVCIYNLPVHQNLENWAKLPCFDPYISPNIGHGDLFYGIQIKTFHIYHD